MYVILITQGQGVSNLTPNINKSQNQNPVDLQRPTQIKAQRALSTLLKLTQTLTSFHTLLKLTQTLTSFHLIKAYCN